MSEFFLFINGTERTSTKCQKKKKKIDENRKNVSGRMCLMIILKVKRIFTISLENAVLEPSQPF